MNLRRYTDPVGRWLLRRLQDEDLETHVTERLKREEEAREIENNFLGYFEQRTKTYLLIVFLVGMGVMGFDHLLGGSLPNQMAGVLIEIMGAIVLGRGILRGQFAVIIESPTRFDSQAEEAMTRDIADGLWGIALLIFGAVLALFFSTNFGARLSSLPF